jgi:plastocyanin
VRTGLGPRRGLALAFVVGGAAVVLAAVVGTARSARSSSGAQVFTVNVDGHNPKANENFIAFFPSVVRVHPGDTVVFDHVGNGEPHTVALGTLANGAVAAFDKLSPAQQANPPKSALRADAKVPQLLPNGPGDAIQASANPCFIATGAPPAKGSCPNVAQPAFDGTQSFYDSGWLSSNQKFTVRLSSSTPPGSYRFLCLLHREGMAGKIVVVPSSTAVASPAAQFGAGQKQLATNEATLAPAVALERQGKPPSPAIKLPPGSVLAGSGEPGSHAGGITEFGPKVFKVPVGGSVTWWLIGIHSITFNSTKGVNNDIRSVAGDGSVHLNVQAIAPVGGPGEPSKPPKPGKSKITFAVVASQPWNGQAFHSSGVFGNSFPPVIEGYKLTFTRKGTYNYICTVHDNMKGTIVVGGG